MLKTLPESIGTIARQSTAALLLLLLQANVEPAVSTSPQVDDELLLFHIMEDPAWWAEVVVEYRP